MKNIDKIDKYTAQNFTNIILRVKDMISKDSKKEDIIRYLNGFIHENSKEIKDLKYTFDSVYRFIRDNIQTIMIVDEPRKKYYIYYSGIGKVGDVERFQRLLSILGKEYENKKDIPEMNKVVGLAKIMFKFGNFLIDTMDKRIEIDTNRTYTREEKAREIDQLDTMGRNYEDEGSYLSEINKRFQKNVKILLEKE